MIFFVILLVPEYWNGIIQFTFFFYVCNTYMILLELTVSFTSLTVFGCDYLSN